MFKFIRNLFSKKEKEIKRYSLTTTDATTGSDSKKDLNPDISEIISKLKASKEVSRNELNLVSSFFFDTPNLNVNTFIFNKDFLSSSVFELAKLETTWEKNGDIKDIIIVLKEITYNEEILIKMSIKCFSEFFNEFKLNLNGKEENVK